MRLLSVLFVYIVLMVGYGSILSGVQPVATSGTVANVQAISLSPQVPWGFSNAKLSMQHTIIMPLYFSRML